jgi:hypothetical protein
MFVKSFEFVQGEAQPQVDPQLVEVEAALRSLDGEERDGIILNSGGQSYMGISGGERGRYVVAGYLEGQGSFICANGNPDGPRKDVVVARDYNTYASKNVVCLEDAIVAAKAFCKHGALSYRLKWENDRG